MTPTVLSRRIKETNDNADGHAATPAAISYGADAHSDALSVAPGGVMTPTVMSVHAVDRSRKRRTVKALLSVASTSGWALIGFALFGVAWQIVAVRAGRVPTPGDTFNELQTLLGRSFSTSTTHGTGIGLQLWSSLGRVFQGFGLAALFGVPIGLLIGSSKRAWKMFNPLVQLLRPVSPLAWFPIWLVVFKDAPKAAVFVIFITALWPIVLNTAAGAQSVPLDHRNVARVFRFGRFAYLRHVLVQSLGEQHASGVVFVLGKSMALMAGKEDDLLSPRDIRIFRQTRTLWRAGRIGRERRHRQAKRHHGKHE